MKFLSFFLTLACSQLVHAATPFEGQLTKWSQGKGTPVAKLNQLYKLFWDHLMVTYPEWASYEGYLVRRVPRTKRPLDRPLFGSH